MLLMKTPEHSRTSRIPLMHRRTNGSDSMTSTAGVGGKNPQGVS